MMLKPVEKLNEMSRKYPGIWKTLNEIKESRGKNGVPDWPGWCWIPVSAVYTLLAEYYYSNDLIWEKKDAGLVHALASWRYSQGIYRFDSEIYQQVVSTPLIEIPVEQFFNLPEWTIYIELNEENNNIFPDMYGMWVTLEKDANDGHVELRLVLHKESGISLLPLHIEEGATVLSAIEAMLVFSEKHAPGPLTNDIRKLRAAAKTVVPAVVRLLNLVLYLCSKNADMNGEKPQKARPTIIKKKKQWFPAKTPKIWPVGYRVSEWIRQARQKSAGQNPETEGTGSRKSPHIRRAHWHGFWSGPRSEELSEMRKFELKWLPPTPVGFSFNEDELPVIPSIKKINI